MYAPTTCTPLVAYTTTQRLSVTIKDGKMVMGDHSSDSHTSVKMEQVLLPQKVTVVTPAMVLVLKSSVMSQVSNVAKIGVIVTHLSSVTNA